MNLEIEEVQNQKDNDDNVEKVFFRAKKGTNLNRYLLYDNTFDDDDELSNKGQHAYRFPSYLTTEDCYIVLWISEGPRKGTPVEFKYKNKEAGKGRRFYWNRKSGVINNTGDRLTLIRISDSQVFDVKSE